MKDRIDILAEEIMTVADIYSCGPQLRELAEMSERRFLSDSLHSLLRIALDHNENHLDQTPPFRAFYALQKFSARMSTDVMSGNSTVSSAAMAYFLRYIKRDAIAYISASGLPLIGLGPVEDGIQTYLVKEYSAKGRMHECINWCHENHIKFERKLFKEVPVDKSHFRFLQLTIKDGTQNLFFRMKWC